MVPKMIFVLYKEKRDRYGYQSLKRNKISFVLHNYYMRACVVCQSDSEIFLTTFWINS